MREGKGAVDYSVNQLFEGFVLIKLELFEQLVEQLLVRGLGLHYYIY